MRAPHDRVFRNCFIAGERDISSTTSSVWNITLSLTGYRLIRTSVSLGKVQRFEIGDLLFSF